MPEKLTPAQRRLQSGAQYPYDTPHDWRHQGDQSNPPPAKDWAHAAARGCIAELDGRGGADAFFDGVDDAARVEIVGALADIIRTAAQPELIVGIVQLES
jgi:hypothetical protein